MKHYLLYAHGGAYNHGSEASVKCDIELLRKISPGCRITLSSHFPEQDRQFNIDADEIIGRNLNGKTNEEIYGETISRITKDTVCLSVGGDCYCYPNWQRYACIHNKAIEKGAKSILWSCSVEPSMIDNEMLEVFKSHTLIAARESVTFNALKALGLNNVVQTADIAFNLKSVKTDTPPGRYVVLNLSPLVIRKNPGVLTAYQRLIDEISKKTDYNIALLPHVEVSVDNDFEALSLLHGADGAEDRICRIPVGLCAAEYKYIVSKAEACVAARTHVTIAAWSSCVPCIAVGYSAKAKGIAKDVGQGEWVVDIESIDSKGFFGVFSELLNEKNNIKFELDKATIKRKANITCESLILTLQ